MGFRLINRMDIVDEVNVFVCSFLEVHLGIVCACLLNLGPLFKPKNRSNRAAAADFPTSRSLLGDGRFAKLLGLRWMRLKYDTFYGNLTSGWRSWRQNDNDKHKSGSASGKSSKNSSSSAAVAAIEIHNLSEIRIVGSESETLHHGDEYDGPSHYVRLE